MKPVRLPAAATIALPRWGIAALYLLYIVPGLVGRDPWKGDDAASFGIMWTMAHGTLADWLWPHIAGLPMPGEGPLAFWLGALAIRLLGGLLGDPLAARISTALFFLLGSSAVWYTTYLLGRRSEAQPLKLAFGGQPEARDFGRTLADGALLIYLACFGLLLRSHETSAEGLQIALIACVLYLCARLFDTARWTHALQLGLCLGLLVLTRGWVLPVALAATLLLLAVLRGQTLQLRMIACALPVAAAVAALWLLPLSLLRPYDSSPYSAWMLWNVRQIAGPNGNSIAYLLKYGIWFTWPAWPFAGWAVYAWRRQEKTLHIALPLALTTCFVALALVNHHSEEALLLPLLPPLAILAAFGLPTMKRGAINAVDWFAVMVLTGVAAFIWLCWLATQTGWPERFARKAGELAPGFVPEFHPLVFVLALVVTCAWFALVYWRISRRPAVLWRAVVLSSGGVILCWFLLMSLWLPWFNQKVGYAPLARALGAQLAPGDCVEARIDPSQRALFAYFGAVHFSGFGERSCKLLLVQDSRRAPRSHRLPGAPEQWQAVWSGHRAADKDEYFTLYRKRP